MYRIRSKIPSRQQLLPVFSTAVFVSYTWTIYRMLNQLPSWLFYLNLKDILGIAAYVMGFAFLESALLLGCAILLSIIFPEKHFKSKFVAQSFLVMLVLTIGALLYQQHIGMLKWWGWLELVIFVLATFSSITLQVLLFSFIFDRFSWLKRFLEVLSDRLVAFSYLYLPLGLFGLAFILIRNIIPG